MGMPSFVSPLHIQRLCLGPNNSNITQVISHAFNYYLCALSQGAGYLLGGTPISYILFLNYTYVYQCVFLTIITCNYPLECLSLNHQ